MNEISATTLQIPADTLTGKLVPHVPKVYFHSANNVLVGTLTLGEDGITFEGDADEAAKVFFNTVNKLYQESRK